VGPTNAIFESTEASAVAAAGAASKPGRVDQLRVVELPQLGRMAVKEGGPEVGVGPERLRPLLHLAVAQPPDEVVGPPAEAAHRARGKGEPLHEGVDLRLALGAQVEVARGVHGEQVVLEVADRVALEPGDPRREEEVDLLVDGLDAGVAREGIGEAAGEALPGQLLRKAADRPVQVVLRQGRGGRQEQHQCDLHDPHGTALAHGIKER